MADTRPTLRVGQIVIMTLGGSQDAYEVLDFHRTPDATAGGLVKLMPLSPDGSRRSFWVSAWVVMPATVTQIRRARQLYLDMGMSEKALDGWWSCVSGVPDAQ